MGRDVTRLQIVNRTSIKHIVLHSNPEELAITDCIPNLRTFTHIFFDTVETLLIPNGTERTWTNERTDLIISDLHYLNSISIGMDCYWNVCSVKVMNNPSLTTLQIGTGSFRNANGDSLHISNCRELKDISILHGCFTHFKECTIEGIRISIVITRRS